LEYRLFCLQAENAALRRRIALVTAWLNQGVIPAPQDLADMEAQVATEFVQWRARIQEQGSALAQAKRYLARVQQLEQEEYQRLKALYRKLCRLLHPLVNGGESELYQRYWHEVQRTYQNVDVELLAALLTVIEGQAIPEEAPVEDVLQRLNDQRTRLAGQLDRQIERLATLRANPPYVYERLLQDQDWLEDKRRQLDEDIVAEETQQEALTAYLESLKAGMRPH
jgi:hypothetical protein